MRGREGIKVWLWEAIKCVCQWPGLKTGVSAERCSRCLKLFKCCGFYLICGVRDIREGDQDRETKQEKGKNGGERSVCVLKAWSLKLFWSVFPELIMNQVTACNVSKGALHSVWTTAGVRCTFWWRGCGCGTLLPFRVPVWKGASELKYCFFCEKCRLDAQLSLTHHNIKGCNWKLLFLCGHSEH